MILRIQKKTILNQLVDGAVQTKKRLIGWERFIQPLGKLHLARLPLFYWK